MVLGREESKSRIGSSFSHGNLVLFSIYIYNPNAILKLYQNMLYNISYPLYSFCWPSLTRTPMFWMVKETSSQARHSSNKADSSKKASEVSPDFREKMPPSVWG